MIILYIYFLYSTIIHQLCIRACAFTWAKKYKKNDFPSLAEQYIRIYDTVSVSFLLWFICHVVCAYMYRDGLSPRDGIVMWQEEYFRVHDTMVTERRAGWGCPPPHSLLTSSWLPKSERGGTSCPQGEWVGLHRRDKSRLTQSPLHYSQGIEQRIYCVCMYACIMWYSYGLLGLH